MNLGYVGPFKVGPVLFVVAFLLWSAIFCGLWWVLISLLPIPESWHTPGYWICAVALPAVHFLISPLLGSRVMVIRK